MEKKPLKDMSLEELWQLFPIILKEHNPHWKDWYQEEARNLQGLLGDDVRLHHIGSTAIPGIMAKPIVDILVELNRRQDMDRVKEALIGEGFLLMSEEKSRLSFNKGYEEDGFAEKVFHVHVRMAGDTDEIIFRDYLLEHPEIAKQYEELKLSLWKPFEHNRDGYTNAKTDFVCKYTKVGKQIYGKTHCQPKMDY